MTHRAASLRQRLFFLIVLPIFLVATALGYWRYAAAQDTAEELFDRSLLSAALAISRDVAVSGGDALLPSSRKLIEDAAGGEVFYHATGPGGYYVTGYAYPPVDEQTRHADPYLPHYFEATYRSEKVRVLRITERITIGNLTGDATVTAWQRLNDRQSFAQQLALKAAALMGGLLFTLGLVVWFGVAYGLRPLTNLEQAIAARSPEDLSTIKRPVPAETRGIVRTLNRLFSRLENSINAQQDFISNAAHQLRNPTAAVQSLAEAVRDAPDATERKERIEAMVLASRNSARIAEQLLSLDRLQFEGLSGDVEPIDLNALTQQVCTEAAPRILARGVAFELELFSGNLRILGDRLFIGEALKNLIDNAMAHGGGGLSLITVTTFAAHSTVGVTIKDDGVGLSPLDAEQAFGRFSQLRPSAGSGLGLAIARAVAERHRGNLKIDPAELGASLTLSFPAVGETTAMTRQL